MDAIEKKLLIGLQSISETDFVEHIEDDDFFQTFGNPVIIECDSGFKLLAIAWKLYERQLRAAGMNDEADEIIRQCAETVEVESAENARAGSAFPAKAESDQNCASATPADIDDPQGREPPTPDESRHDGEENKANGTEAD